MWEVTASLSLYLTAPIAFWFKGDFLSWQLALARSGLCEQRRVYLDFVLFSQGIRKDNSPMNAHNFDGAAITTVGWKGWGGRTAQTPTGETGNVNPTHPPPPPPQTQTVINGKLYKGRRDKNLLLNEDKHTASKLSSLPHLTYPPPHHLNQAAISYAS